MKFKLDASTELFNKHLNIKGNKSLIFSGAFGTGKTYFLREYFEKSDKFEAIHLYPVNYSVASNEDIFELIKYDILFCLLEKNLDFEKVEISKATLLPYFLKNNSSKILPILLGLIPKVGGSLKNIAEGLIQLEKRFKDEVKKNEIDEQETIISYLKVFTGQKGTIHEEDFITQLISQLVEQLKHREIEIVLIVDDLDRIDPEHIFRIFNILSAHVDIDKEQNKFDFDRIILVCDIKNIRNIFRNRYGINVDFSGYIDKFYSKSIFHYDLSSEVIENFHNIMEHTPDLMTKSNFSSNTIYILLGLLEFNLLPIRTLNRILDSEIKIIIRDIGEDYITGSKITSNEIGLINTIYYLRDLFQDCDLLVSNCQGLIGKKFKNPLKISKELLITELIKAVDFKSYHKNILDIREESGKLSVYISRYNFIYTIKRTWHKNNPSVDIYRYVLDSITHSGSSGNKVNIGDIDYFKLLTWVLEDSDFGKVIKE
jgi:hypothetical protein